MLDVCCVIFHFEISKDCDNSASVLSGGQLSSDMRLITVLSVCS